jgi:hypothetical protein
MASADCTENDAPLCAGCPGAAAEVCAEGICQPLEPRSVDVSVSVNFADRGLATSARSLVHVVADERGPEGKMTCADAFAENDLSAPLSDQINVLAAADKSISGGSFHPDVHFGRVPPGPVLVLAWITDDTAGEGSVLAQGCADTLLATGNSLVVDVLTLE